MGFEPTTSSLGNWSSTPELPPLIRKPKVTIISNGEKWYKIKKSGSHKNELDFFIILMSVNH